MTDTKGINMDIPSILTRNYPNTQWSLNGDQYDGLDWLDETPKPTEQELADAWPAVQTEMENDRARQARAADYAAEADLLRDYWLRDEGTKDVWVAKVAEVRARHPYVEVTE